MEMATKGPKSSVSGQYVTGKKEITSDAISMPVTHIFSSPGEPSIISSVFIDLLDYLICMTFTIISQY